MGQRRPGDLNRFSGGQGEGELLGDQQRVVRLEREDLVADAQEHTVQRLPGDIVAAQAGHAVGLEKQGFGRKLGPSHGFTDSSGLIKRGDDRIRGKAGRVQDPQPDGAVHDPALDGAGSIKVTEIVLEHLFEQNARAENAVRFSHSPSIFNVTPEPVLGSTAGALPPRYRQVVLSQGSRESVPTVRRRHEIEVAVLNR